MWETPDAGAKTPGDAPLNSIIEIAGVQKRYGRIIALEDVALTVRHGVTGLLGPNGSGKSTLIKALLGLVRAQGGSGTVLGNPWPQGVRSIRDNVGYLPEDDCYIAGLSGIDSVTLMARLSGLPGTEGLRRSHEIMDFCDIGEERYRQVEGYSTGMRQKLKFAQALVHDPQLLILDEPTTGLDPDQRKSMLSRIRTLAVDHGKTIMLSTHILHDVRTICDDVVMLVGGRVRLTDSLENLSRPASPTMHVSVHGSQERLVERLRREGLVVTPTRDGGLRVEGISSSEVDRLWSWAAETETAIRNLEPAVNSLEQVFFEAAGAEESSVASHEMTGS
ncbi:MAG: ABC transporter ATP-binding protein [Planctomycetota bacterium]